MSMIRITCSKEIKTREELGKLCNDRGLLGFAVEVGTWEGEFAAQFLKHWRGACLYCVDSYAPNALYPGYERDEEVARREKRLNAPYIWHARMKEPLCVDRAELWQMTSIEGSLGWSDANLDLVYLDGDHTNPGFQQDLEAWWPKLRSWH